MALSKEELEVTLSLLEDEVNRCHRCNDRRTIKAIAGARIKLNRELDVLTNRYESTPLYRNQP